MKRDDLLAVIGGAILLFVIVAIVATCFNSLLMPSALTWGEQESDADILHRDAGRAYETTMGTRSK